MRALPCCLATAACATTACATAEIPPDAPSGSTRDALARGEARLMVAPEHSGGAITAARRLSDGWDAGLVDLHVASGALVVAAESDGTLALDRLQVSFAPIPIGPDVLGRDAVLAGVRVETTAPVRLDTHWIDDDEVRASGALPLGLSWVLVVDGAALPLGMPVLPAIDAALDLTGGRGALHAELRLAASGPLWSWADLVRLDDLRLILVAAAPPPG